MDYFFRVEPGPDDDHKREKTVDLGDGESYDTFEYKVGKEYTDAEGNTETRREVGHGLDLDKYPEIDDELENSENFEGAAIDTSIDSWIDADLIDAETESVLSMLVEKLEQIFIAEGLPFTRYQLYGLASHFYTSGGISAIENDTWGIIQAYRDEYTGKTVDDILSTYGLTDELDISAGDLGFSVLSKMTLGNTNIQLGNGFITGRMEKDALLFYTGRFWNSVDEIWCPLT